MEREVWCKGRSVSGLGIRGRDRDFGRKNFSDGYHLLSFVFC